MKTLAPHQWISIGGMVIEGIGFGILTLEVWNTHRGTVDHLRTLLAGVTRNDAGETVGIKFEATLVDDEKGGSQEGGFFRAAAQVLSDMEAKASNTRRNLIIGGVMTIFGLALQVVATYLG